MAKLLPAVLSLSTLSSLASLASAYFSPATYGFGQKDLMLSYGITETREEVRPNLNKIVF
jgi:hypothetical protein